MAYKLIRNPQEYIGTNAERIAMVTTEVKAGSSFYTTDTKTVYIWDGTAWQAM